MNSKQRWEIEFNVTNGGPEQRLRAACIAQPRLRQEMARLTKDMGHQCGEYQAWCEAWLSRRLAGDARPFTLPQDARDARLATVMAWLLTLVHLGLDVVIALTMLVNPLALIGVSLALIFGVKSTLLLLLDDRVRPQLTKRRLQRGVLWPSLIALLLSAVVLAGGRALTGALLLWFSGLFTWALFGLSLSCMGLATGLYSMAYLFSRSAHAERRYVKTEQEAVETLRVLQLTEQVERELQAPPPVRQMQPALRRPATPAVSQPARAAAQFMPLHDPRVAKVKDLARNGYHQAVLPLLLLGAASLSGCQSLVPGQAANAQPVAAPAVSPAKSVGPTVRVYVDWSLSESDQPLAEGARKLAEALLHIVAFTHAAQVAVYQFGANGWEAQPVTAIALPALESAEAGEAEWVFGKLGEAQRQAAEAAYQQRAAAQLKGLTASVLLPPADAVEPRCTDVQGVLRRIADSQDETRGLVILLSDFHETCSEALAPVAVGPQAPVLVVMLLPERKEEAGATAAHELYARRRAEIARVYPGAVVVPHFGNVAQAVQKAWLGAAAREDKTNK